MKFENSRMDLSMSKRKRVLSASGIKTGTARLVGTSLERIISEVSTFLKDPDRYRAMGNAINSYGNDRAAKRIVKVLKTSFKKTAQ